MRWLFLCLLAPLFAQTTELPWEAPGPHGFEVVDHDWHDEERAREVPVRIYLPEGDGACPVIVMSHGLGGSREGYVYLGEHWASHGYISVHVQHHGSDDAVWRGQRRPMQALKQAVADPQNALERPRDVSFVLDRLVLLHDEPESAFHGRVDIERAAVAGHSFGAYTALAACGRSPVKLWNQRDPRLKACLPMSAPAKQPDQEATFYSDYDTPTLHLTGTLDDIPIGDTMAEDRRNPFDAIRSADQFLLIFDGGDHMIFSGRGEGGGLGLRGWGRDGERDEAFQQAIRTCATAFFEAYLREDGKAEAWLWEDCEGWLGALGSFESRRKP